MADKRMFSVKIVESDAFGELPLSAQALYFHINMAADDDGFTNRVKAICRYIGASQEDIDALVSARFLLSFGNGVYCVKHWLINNNQRKDRYHPTQYQDEFAQLEVKPNLSYTEKSLVAIGGIPSTETEMVAIGGIPRIEENKREENKREENNIEEKREEECRGEERETNGADTAAQTPTRSSAGAPSSPPSAYLGKHGNVLLSKKEIAQLKLVFPTDWGDKVERMSDYLFHGGRCDVPHYDFILSFV